MFARKPSVQEKHLSFDHVTYLDVDIGDGMDFPSFAHYNFKFVFCLLLCRSSVNSNWVYYSIIVGHISTQGNFLYQFLEVPPQSKLLRSTITVWKKNRCMHLQTFCGCPQVHGRTLWKMTPFWQRKRCRNSSCVKGTANSTADSRVGQCQRGRPRKLRVFK